MYSQQQADSSQAEIYPNSVEAGTTSQRFNYSLHFFGGTADSITIHNPFGVNEVYLISAKIDGSSKSLLNSTNRPLDSSRVNWYYSSVDSNLILLTDTSLIKDSIHVKFATSVPTSAENGLEFSSKFKDARYVTPIQESKQIYCVVDVLPSDIAKLLIETNKDGTGIEVEDFEIKTDEIRALYAIGRDIYNNLIDSTINVNWTVGNDIGTLSPQNPTSSIIFNPRKPGSGIISISNGILADQTGLISVTTGEVSYIEILNGPDGKGEKIGDLVITTDTLLILYPAGYDSDSNYVMDEKVDWTSTFLSNVVSSHNSYLKFIPMEANDIGQIVVNNSNNISDSTGTISIINPPSINYINNSLSPKLVTTYQNVAFSILVKNNGDVAVELDTLTNFRFGDSLGYSYNSNLLERTMIMPDSTVQLLFETSIISKYFSPGDYKPIISAIGIDSRNNSYVKDIIVNDHPGLKIAAITIDRINVKRINPLTQGQDNINFEISMMVSNHSDSDINNVEGYLIFNGSSNFDGFNTKSFSSIPQGRTRELLFTGRINLNSVPDIYIVDGYVSGNVNGLLVFDNSSTIKDSLIITAPPNLNNSFLDPAQVTSDQYVTFELTIINSGGTGLTIYPDSSSLLCRNSDSTMFSIQIADTMQIPKSSQKSIIFSKTLIKPISPRLVIKGIDDNGFEFNKSVNITPGIVDIQDPPLLAVYENLITPRKTTQGSAVSFSIAVNNSGGNPAIVSVNNTKIRFGNADTSFVAILNNNFTLNNSELGTIKFGYAIIPKTLPVGQYKMDIILGGVDANGKEFFFSYTTESEVVEIQAPPNIEYDNYTSNDTITIGDSYSLSVNVKNTGQIGFSVSSTNSFLTINDGSGLESQMFIAQLKNDIYINTGQQNLKLDFIPREIPHQFIKGRYPIQLDLSGWDSNLSYFQQNDIIADSISVLRPPLLEYIPNTFSNNSIFIADSVQFSLKVKNTGDVDIELDDNIKLILGEDNLQEFACTSLLGTIHSQDTLTLYFEKDSLELSLGKYNAFLFLEGSYLDSMRISQNIYSIENVYVIIEDPPMISSIRYIDGGYNNIPDGKIDSTDLIAVKFTENVAANSRIGNDANEYFTIVSESDFFSSEGFSSIITEAEAVGYYGTDADSILFIDLNGIPILATNCSSNRDEYISNSIRRTIIKAEYSPTQIIINQNIKEGLIISDSGNDIGLAEYNNVRANQLEELNNYETGPGYFSKFALIVDDGTLPSVFNIYPDSSDTKYISKYSSYKAFVTGRNFIRKTKLQELLGMVYNTETAELFSSPSNFKNLHDSLRSGLASGDSIQIFNLIDTLSTHKLIIDRTDTDIVLNPLALMFTNILPNSFQYTINDNYSIQYDSLFEDNIASSESSDLSIGFIPKYNISISNPGKLISGTTESIIVRFNFEDILGHSVIFISDSYEFQKPSNIKRNDSYTIMSAPNPFKPGERVVIDYEVEQSVSGGIDIIIIDSAGREVFRCQGESTPGRHRINNFDGTNQSGIRISRGVYLCILHAEGKAQATWIMVAK